MELGNDGFPLRATEVQLNNCVEFILETVPNLEELVLTYFPSDMVGHFIKNNPYPLFHNSPLQEFPAFRSLTTTTAGLHLAETLTSLKYVLQEIKKNLTN